MSSQHCSFTGIFCIFHLLHCLQIGDDDKRGTRRAQQTGHRDSSGYRARRRPGHVPASGWGFGANAASRSREEVHHVPQNTPRVGLE